MIALDTNVLVHALISSQPEHDVTKEWLLATNEPLVTTHTNVAEFLRLTTHPRVFQRALDLKGAVALLSAFLDAFDVEVLADPEAWWENLGAAFPMQGIRGNEVFDACIALCLRHHGVTRICTRDSDFHKYAFLTVLTPT